MRIYHLLLIGLCLTLNSCVKDKCSSQYCLNGGACLDGSCKCPTGFSGPHCEQGSSNAKVFFFMYEDAGWGKATITCSGQSAILSQYYCSTCFGQPTCGDAGGATFELAPGSYTYHIVWDNGKTYDGSVSVTAGECKKEPYYCLVPNVFGNVSFYNINPNISNIKVTVDGTNKYISTLSTTQPANCLVNGNANFELLPGDYTYHILANNGSTSSGTITVTANQCLLVTVQ